MSHLSHAFYMPCPPPPPPPPWLIILTMFVQVCKLWRSPACSLLQPPATAFNLILQNLPSELSYIYCNHGMQSRAYCSYILQFRSKFLQLSQYSDWDWGSISGGGWEFFSPTPCADRLRGPPSLLSNGYRVPFPGDKAVGAWSWPLTSTAEFKNAWRHTSTHLHGVVLC